MRRGLQILLTVLGAVAFVAGLQTMLAGADAILGVGRPSPSADSEMRFYAAWYAAAGGIVLWSVPRIEREAAVVRIVGGTFFAAASARLLSIVVVGRPHTLAVVLMFVEWTIPLVIVPWQAAVARRAGSKP